MNQADSTARQSSRARRAPVMRECGRLDCAAHLARLETLNRELAEALDESRLENERLTRERESLLETIAREGVAV